MGRGVEEDRAWPAGETRARGCGLPREGRVDWGRREAGRARSPQEHWPKPTRARRPLAARRCSSFYNLPTERASLRKICHRDVCRCAEGDRTGTRGPAALPRGRDSEIGGQRQRETEEGSPRGRG